MPKAAKKATLEAGNEPAQIEREVRQTARPLSKTASGESSKFPSLKTLRPSIKRGSFGLRDPVLHSPAFLASSCSTSSLQQPVSEFKDARDSDVTAGESQFCLSVGGGCCLAPARLSNLCATQGHRISLKLHQVRGAGAWLVGGTTLCNTTSASLFRPGQTVHPKSYTDFYDHAAVCPCAGDRNRRHNAIKPAAVGEKASLLQPAWTPTDSLSERAAWQGHDPEAWNFAVTSCLRPATQDTGPTTLSTRNLTEFETLKRSFHDSANRCHQNGLRFTPVVFDGHAGGWVDSARNLVTWIFERLSTPSHRTPSDINLELAQRISSSLHRDSVRATLRHRTWGDDESLTTTTVT